MVTRVERLVSINGKGGRREGGLKKGCGRSRFG